MLTLPSLSLSALSLRAKIVALCTLSCACATLVVALLCGELQEQSLRQTSRELQLALVQDVASHAQDHLDQTRRELESLARALTQSALDPSAQIEVVKALLESSQHLDHIDVFDAQGQWIDRVRTGGPATPPATSLSAPAQEQALHRGRFVAPVQLQGDTPRQGWVLPLRAQGKLTGFVASEVNLSPIESHLRTLAAQHLPGVAHALYLRADPELIIASSHPVKRQGAPDPFLRGFDALPPDLGVAQDLAQCPDTRPNCEDLYLGTVMRMSGQPWVVVAKIPARVAYAPLHKVRQRLLLAVLGSVGITMLVSFALARRMTSPLSALVQMSSSLMQRRFDHTGLLQRGDELGQLARALSQAVQDLQLSGSSRNKGTREDAPIPSQTKPQRASTRIGSEPPQHSHHGL